MSEPSQAKTDASRAGLRNYVVVTGAYWADTVTDGATRMLVLFYFYNLGYSPLAVASLFIFYEVFGILTNLFGGYIGARFGLKTTLFIGLGTQLVALSMLAFAPQSLLVVAWVMASQALSGIAKDMTKMSSKSAVKLIVPENASDTLYRWVAILTGSKNALKGVGFFLGGLLLTVLDFQTALKLLVVLVGVALILAATADARRPRVRPTRRPSFRRSSRTMRQSTSWPQRASSSLVPATSGSSSACRCSFAAYWIGPFGRRVVSSQSG
jgi:MFS family permease